MRLQAAQMGRRPLKVLTLGQGIVQLFDHPFAFIFHAFAFSNIVRANGGSGDHLTVFISNRGNSHGYVHQAPIFAHSHGFKTFHRFTLLDPLQNVGDFVVTNGRGDEGDGPDVGFFEQV